MRIWIGIALVVVIGLIWSVAIMSKWVPVNSAEMKTATVSPHVINGTASYSANVWAFHKDLGAQVRRNADAAVNLDIAVTKFVMQQMLIRKDRIFMSKYMVNSVWATDVTGTAGGSVVVRSTAAVPISAAGLGSSAA